MIWTMSCVVCCTPTLLFLRENTVTEVFDYANLSAVTLRECLFYLG